MNLVIHRKWVDCSSPRSQHDNTDTFPRFYTIDSRNACQRRCSPVVQIEVKKSITSPELSHNHKYQPCSIREQDKHTFKLSKKLQLSMSVRALKTSNFARFAMIKASPTRVSSRFLSLLSASKSSANATSDA